jgi:hypothetical protein
MLSMTDPLQRIDSSVLMSFADGELAPEDAAHVEAALAADPSLRDEVESYRRTRRILDQTLGPVANVPPPQHLIDLIKHTTPPAPGATRKIVSFAAHAKARPVWIDALAACMLLGAGVGAGLILTPRQASSADLAVAVALDGTLTGASVVAVALEKQPSATILRQNGVNVKPVQTFFVGERPCREFEVSTEGTGAVGIACRTPDGWRLETILTADVSADSGYQIASGPNDALIDDVLDRLSATTGLEREPEACLLERGWLTDGASACGLR